MRLVAKIGIVLACAMLLVACGSEQASDSPADTDATPAPATPPSVPEMTLGQIVWAQEIDAATGEPVEIVRRFTRQSPAIIAAIEVDNIPEGTEFTATWTINDQPINVAEMDIVAREDLPHAWVAFSFSRDEDRQYPVGTLGVVITTSDGQVREDSIEIGFP